MFGPQATKPCPMCSSFEWYPPLWYRATTSAWPLYSVRTEVDVRHSLAWCAAVALAVAACDGGSEEVDAGTDAATEADCTDMADGTPCAAAMICVGGACTTSECGDGFVDSNAGEECEDDDDIAFDGCDPGCTLTCEGDEECSNGDPCDGEETCSGDNTCVAQGGLPDDSECTLGDESGTCRASRCVLPGCPNGFMDEGEVCDDGNVTDGDGCDSDCTYTCDETTSCEDGDECNGVAVCLLGSHTCMPGTPLDCNDRNACTIDSCNPVSGCTHRAAMDGDGDGFSSMATLACGTDCDDTDDTIYPGAPELCDAIDQDCDDDPAPSDTPTWYLDCDGDGFAATGATSMMQCDEPAATGCGGGWTPRAPAGDDTDCDDGSALVSPRGTEVAGDAADDDEDCDGSVLCLADGDNDGWRTDVEVASADADCADAGEARSAEMSGDCDDARTPAHPNAAELCNARDDDCDGTIDDGASCGNCTVQANAGHTYLFCRDSLTWLSARDACLGLGYDLVQVGDSAENTWLSTTVFAMFNDDYWLGLTDYLNEGMWVWNDGTVATFFAWGPGQPDGGNLQDCAFLANGDAAQETRGAWNDRECAISKPYICESR
jgi:cysteine-rich repeat protein